MKTSVLITAMSFLASFTVASADICKLKETDGGFLKSKYTHIGEGWSQTLVVGFLTDEKNLLLHGIYRREFKGGVITVDTDTPLLLNLEGGRELILYPLDDSRAKKTFHGFVWNKKKLESSYAFSKDDLNWLATASLKSAIIKIKIDGQLDEKEFEVREKRSKRLMEIAGCLLPIASTTEESAM